MQGATQSKENAVSSHVADDESIVAGRTGPGSAFVVTDSRVLSMEDGETDGRSVRSVRSTLLTEGIRGVEVREIGSKTVDWTQAVLGCLVLFGGVVSMGVAFDNSGATSVGAMLLGVVALFGGGYLLYDSFDTPDGEIRVDVKTDAGTDTYWLPEDESDVASAVSEVVGKNSKG